MDLKKLKIDNNLAEQGQWVDFGEGFRMKIARKNNKAYQKFITNHPKIKPYVTNPKAISDDVWQEVYDTARATHIIVDWEGAELDGKPFPYSVENALMVLTDPAFEEIANDVETISSAYATYREQEVEEIPKK